MNRANVGASTNVLQMLIDTIMGFLTFVLTYFLVEDDLIIENVKSYFGIYIIFIVVYILTNKDSNLYNITTFYYIDRIFRCVTKAYLFGSGCILCMVHFVNSDKSNNLFAYVFLSIIYFVLVISTLIFRYIHKVFMGKFSPRCIFVGEEALYDKFNYFMEKTNINHEFLGYVSDDNIPGEGYIGYIKDLEHIIRTFNVDQIYFMIKDDDFGFAKQYIDMCAEMGVTVKLIMDLYKNDDSKSYVGAIGTYPVLTYHCISLNATEKAIKRLIDILGSIVGIILFSPIMLVAAIAVKVTSKGPVIFKQTRVGMNGRLFKIYKFRTMYESAEDMKKQLMEQNEVDGFMFKMQDDPRITSVGKFLRKTSIDEFPQFFNVFFGDMSLVGTRPPTIDEVSQYETSHWKRICTKPGITGLWQVSGRSKITSFEEIVALDVKYINNWSVFQDIKIMLKTVKVLLKRDGAY